MKLVLSFLAGVIFAAVLIVGFRSPPKLTAPTEVTPISQATNGQAQQQEYMPDEDALLAAVESQSILQAPQTNSETTSVVPPPPGSSYEDLYGDDYMPGVLIEYEAFDPDWAPAMQSQVRSFLEDYLLQDAERGARYSLVSVRCRTTICEAVFHDYTPNPDLFNRDRSLNLGDMRIGYQEWADQLDRVKTQMIYGVENGLLEYYLYLTRKQAVDSH